MALPTDLGTRCPDGALRHGPLDRQGECPWCHQKIGRAVLTPLPRVPVSDLTDAYRTYYDPDWGSEWSARR